MRSPQVKEVNSSSDSSSSEKKKKKTKKKDKKNKKKALAESGFLTARFPVEIL